MHSNAASRTRLYAILLIDAFVFLLCMAGMNQIAQKAGLGRELTSTKDASGQPRLLAEGLRVWQGERCDLREGDIIHRIEGFAVHTPEEAEALLDLRGIGERVQVEREWKGTRETVPVRLVRYYSNSYIALAFFAGFVYFFIGIFVLIKRPENSAARAFHPVSVTTAVLITTTWGHCTLPIPGIDALLRVAFVAAYAFDGMLLLHFTFHFPVRKPGLFRWVLVPGYALGAVIFAVVSWQSLAFFSHPTQETLDVFVETFQLRRWPFIVGLALGVANIAHSYWRATAASDRRNIRLALAGLSITATGFGGLWLLPVALGYPPLISDEMLTLLSVFGPISFAISIVKYRLFEIDFFLKRGLVYGLVLAGMMGVYALIDWIIIATFPSVTYGVLLAVSAVTFIVTYLVIEPAGGFIQRVIDRRFFRVHYDFREAQRTIANRIRQSYELQQLAETVVTEIDRVIPVCRIGIFVLRPAGDRLHLVAHLGFDALEGRGVPFRRDALRFSLEAPVGLTQHVEPGLPVEEAEQRTFARWGLALTFPMLGEHREIIGFLALGPKRSGTRFSLEDIDLLSTVTAQTGLSIERVLLQQRLLLEKLESKRLGELNQLKSYFVSSVSHELRTPLTSIRMFSEMLRDTPELAPAARDNYLRIIEGETDRLSRLISNVLDYARIEHGVKTYHPQTADLNLLAGHVLEVLDYQIRMKRFTVHRDFDADPLPVLADTDAVEQALINLVSNAMKYSGDAREITVRTRREGGDAVAEVEDKGIGISAADQARLFEPFFRAGGETVERVAGAGLGLTIIKHIMDAHGGRIDLESAPGAGSTFRLRFPRPAREDALETGHSSTGRIEA